MTRAFTCWVFVEKRGRKRNEQKEEAGMQERKNARVQKRRCRRGAGARKKKKKGGERVLDDAETAEGTLKWCQCLRRKGRKEERVGSVPLSLRKEMGGRWARGMGRGAVARVRTRAVPKLDARFQAVLYSSAARPIGIEPVARAELERGRAGGAKGVALRAPKVRARPRRLLWTAGRESGRELSDRRKERRKRTGLKESRAPSGKKGAAPGQPEKKESAVLRRAGGRATTKGADDRG